VAETGDPCIAAEEFIANGHSTLERGSQLFGLSRLHRTSRAKRKNRRNSTTKFSLTYSTSSPPLFYARRTKRRNSIPNFSLTTPSNFISWCDQMLAVVPDLSFLWTGGVSQRSPCEREAAQKGLLLLRLPARLEFELRSALSSIKFR
jgi:hypothetical protein